MSNQQWLEYELTRSERRDALGRQLEEHYPLGYDDDLPGLLEELLAPEYELEQASHEYEAFYEGIGLGDVEPF